MKNIYIISFAGIVAALLLTFLLLFQATQIAHASAPSGLPARVATTSQSTVGTSAVVLFATSTCAARIITTYAQPIMLTFSDYAGQSPTGTLGVLQAASTTAVYDSGQYGCDLVKAYSFATQLITISEAR